MKRYRFKAIMNVVLSEDEIWPDGVPDNPTLEDLADSISDSACAQVTKTDHVEVYSDAYRLIHDWGLEDDLTILVSEVVE